MSLQNIFTELEKTDSDIYDRMDTRRNAMKQFANFTGKAALAAMPLALASMLKKAYGQVPTGVVDTLQYALVLERLEYGFYAGALAGTAVTTGAGASTAGIQAITKIRDHELAHTNYLITVISALGSTAAASPTFDYTAGNGSNAGPFVGWNTNYDVFLAVAQTLEDTGVRAYKGAAGNLITNKDVLTAALNIHSVEARHASHLRYMRRARATVAGAAPVYVGNIKPWIEGNQSNIGGSYTAAVQPNYNGEENVTTLGVNVQSTAGTSAALATGSFDEILTPATVLTLVDPFIV